MLLGIAGVTGVGKSYYKDKIVNELNFNKVKIITTREMRTGEKNNEDKIFVTKDELQNLKDEEKIAYEFEYLGNIYAYKNEDFFTDKNMVFELHYTELANIKKVCKNLKTLYLLPESLEIPIQKTKERHLKPEVEKDRIAEIKDHYNKICTDENLRKMFDKIIYNRYTKETDDEVINAIKNEMK